MVWAGATDLTKVFVGAGTAIDVTGASAGIDKFAGVGGGPRGGSMVETTFAGRVTVLYFG